MKKMDHTGKSRHNNGSRRTQEEQESNVVSDETRILVKESLVSFVRDNNSKELSFPTTFSNIDRKLVHSLAQDHGLKSKSFGKEPERFVKVFKNANWKEPQSSLSISQKSTNLINEFLVKNPPTESDRTTTECNSAQSTPKTLKKTQLSEVKLLYTKTNFERTKEFRDVLPIQPYSKDIIGAIEEGRVTLVVGETGSGKTTQVPQMIMEDAELKGRPCQIICSMPRRVAAITISERVAFERGETLGQTIGYQIKLDSRVSSQTVLTYCTNGVLLRSLLHGGEWLANVSHIIIDEVHERDKLTDFTLIVLKNALITYNLKLILMSATIDCDKFKAYFKDCPRPGDECKEVRVPGQLFEVKEIYLEDILEGTQYMSPEMYSAKQERESRGGTESQGNQRRLMRSLAAAPVASLEERVAMIALDLKTRMNRLLEIAFKTGTAKALKNLLDFIRMADIPVDYQHPECGRTALMAAAVHSDIDAIDDLIHMDPDLAVESKEGKTALMYAEEAGDADILDWFNAYITYCERKKLSAASPAAVENELPPEVQERVDIYEKCHIKKDIDEDLIFSLLKTIHDDGREGAVLVFLPGYEHIMRVRDKILENLNVFKKRPLDIHILHSRIKSIDQKRVFEKPPSGKRKVILSTNIAETSITISDVCFVIDCGKIKELSYNSMSRAYTLECDWISQSCAQQRKGRAGRTRDGMCFRLYTRKRFQALSPHKIPELLREPIAELCLQAKQLAPTETSIADFLGKAIDPPLPDDTRNTISLLKKMEALTSDEQLTTLGRHLLDIPVDPQFGIMIIYAIILKCLDPVLNIVCCLSSGELFKLPADPDAKAKTLQMRIEMSKGSLSDHIVYLNAFRKWEAAAKLGRERIWCQEHLVSASAMEMIALTKRQILGQLKSKLSPDVNHNADNWAVVKAAITVGLYPNIARVDPKRKCLQTPNELKVVIHNGSVLRCGGGNNVPSLRSLPSDWILYQESHQVRGFTNVRTCTVVSPLTVFIFAGPSLLPSPKTSDDVDSVCQENNVIHVDKFVNFNVDKKTSENLQLLRRKWSTYSRKALGNLEKQGKVDDSTLSTVVELLTVEEQPKLGLQPMEPKEGPDIGLPIGRGRGRGEFRGIQRPGPGPAQPRPQFTGRGRGEMMKWIRDHINDLAVDNMTSSQIKVTSSRRDTTATSLQSSQQHPRESPSLPSSENNKLSKTRTPEGVTRNQETENLDKLCTGRGLGDGNYGPNNNGSNSYSPNNYRPKNRGANNNGPYGTNNYGPHNRGPNNYGPNNHEASIYGANQYGPTTYGPNDYRPNNHGASNYEPNNCGPNNSGPNNYGPNNYRPNNYGPNNQRPNNYGPNYQRPNNYGPNNQRPNNYGPNNHGPNKYGPNYGHGGLRGGYHTQPPRGRGGNDNQYFSRDNYMDNQERKDVPASRGRPRNAGRGAQRGASRRGNFFQPQRENNMPKNQNLETYIVEDRRKEIEDRVGNPRPTSPDGWSIEEIIKKRRERKERENSRTKDAGPSSDDNTQSKKPEDVKTRLLDNQCQKKFRFFLIKKGSLQLAQDFFKVGYWAVTKETMSKLIEAQKNTEHIFLILMVKPPGTSYVELQGYGKLCDSTDLRIRLPGQPKELSVILRMEWRVTDDLPIETAGQEDFKPLFETSDGGELEDSLANLLLYMWNKEYRKRTGQDRPLY